MRLRACMRACVCACVCMCVSVCVCMHTRMHACVWIVNHIGIYMYMYDSIISWTGVLSI